MRIVGPRPDGEAWNGSLVAGKAVQPWALPRVNCLAMLV